MQLYKKILVAIDCSPVDETIIRHITGLAKLCQAKVSLIHVVHSHTLDQERSLHEKARPILEGYQKRLQDEGIEAEILLYSGEPDEEILKEIETDHYDLVAMATHGHTFFGDLLFGSVSRSLKHKISIPLLLLRAEHHD